MGRPSYEPIARMQRGRYREQTRRELAAVALAPATERGLANVRVPETAAATAVPRARSTTASTGRRHDFRRLVAAEPAPRGEYPEASDGASASNGHAPGHYRLRYDRLDPKGKMTIRRAGQMHHLGIGTKHARKRVLALADEHHITVIEPETGEVLRPRHRSHPRYWRNQQREPGRWPGSEK
jgi:hypothetical protein